MGGWCSHKIAQVPSRPGPPCEAASGLCHPAPPRPASRGRCARRAVSVVAEVRSGPWSLATRGEPGPSAPARVSFSLSPPPRPPGNLEDSRLAERMAEWGFCSHLFQAGSVPDFCEQVEVPLPHTHPGASDHTPSPLGRQRRCHTRAQSSLEAYSPQAVFQS